jgi:hypothetical protein
MYFDNRETATVLAALRHWQNTSSTSIDTELFDIATNCGTLERLTDDEIDDLCERVNVNVAPIVEAASPT